MNFLISKISRRKLDALIAPFKTEAQTLEIGARGKPDYTKYFPNRVGVDIKEGIGVDVVADVHALPFSDNTYDVVLCLSVLEHVENPPAAVAEMQRVLKPGGRIILSVPFLFPIHDSPDDFWRFTKYGLRKLFSEGWHIESLSAETNMNEALAVLLQRICYQTKMYANSMLKAFLFAIAWTLTRMPRFTKHIYGDIKKSRLEPDAFASGFFLVAKKTV